MIGVAVAAELVIDGHDVGPISAHEPHQPAGRVVQVRLPERSRIEVPDAAHHVRVVVAEVLPLGDTEFAHRGLELPGPDLAQPAVVVRRVHLGHNDLAHLAARARDEDHPAAVANSFGHHAAGADRLVVGVSVNRHQREAVVVRRTVGSVRRIGRHGAILARVGQGVRFAPGSRRYHPADALHADVTRAPTRIRSPPADGRASRSTCRPPGRRLLHRARRPAMHHAAWRPRC